MLVAAGPRPGCELDPVSGEFCGNGLEIVVFCFFYLVFVNDTHVCLLCERGESAEAHA